MTITLTTFTPNTKIQSSQVNANFSSIKTEVDAITLNSKIITGSRDGTGATADISYTGVGFAPTSIHAIAVVNGTLYFSKGFCDSSKTAWCMYQSAANTEYAGNYLVAYSNQASWGQVATVKSFDADGFTLTWTKLGSPTAGTILLYFICYKAH